MNVEVTDKVSGKKLSVNLKLVRLIEPCDDGVGCHLAFDESMGRVVAENYAVLKPYFQAVIPS